MATKTKAAPKRAAKKKPLTTDLAVCMVLDKSGSMSHLAPSVIAGFNEYVADLREQDGETFVSLTLFDTDFEQVYIGSPLTEVGLLTDDVYRIGGMTALYDAIGHAVKDTEKRLKKEGKSDAKVLVVTMTDGGENSSQDYNASSLAALVKEYEAKGNWTFVYLGLGQSADYVGTLRGVGYSGDSGYFAAATMDGVSSSMSSLSMATTSLRASSAMSSANLLADAGVTNVGAVASVAVPEPGDLLAHLEGK